jgi:hypothetical protein
MTRAIDHFVKLAKAGRIDLDSGSWGHETNTRAVFCGRCLTPVPQGEGQPYNEFMTDCYRASTHYLCRGCVYDLGCENAVQNRALGRAGGS